MPDLTLATAFLAGLLSFLSPCVLPVVPAYLGQLGALTAVAPAATLVTNASVGGAGTAALPSPSLPPATVAEASLALRRGRALLHAAAFVLGFGGVFTALGVTASFIGQGVSAQMPLLRQIGGLILIVLGLNVMGVLRLRWLMRSWKPFERPMGTRGGVANRTPLGALALGGVFAVGWTPCIGPTLGAIFTLSAVGPSAQAGLLFVAYSLGLGVPFVLLALMLDRAPAITRPLVRHGRLIEIVGGALIIVIGLAILFDRLGLIVQLFGGFTAPL